MDRKYTNQLPDRIRKNNATYETLERNAAPSVHGSRGFPLLVVSNVVDPRVARINRARIKANKIKKARGKK